MSSPTQVIVAIDIGSSSVRCSAYKYIRHQQDGTGNDDTAPSVQALENCQAYRSVRSVQPNTGKIRLQGGKEQEKSLMDNLDDCMDELLEKLRRKQHENWFEIVAVGFSCFVMNLVGVDANGCIVGDEASISYACNTQTVAKQCRNLRMQLSEEQMEEMYQQTGAPIHSAYALPQLLDFYDDNNNQCSNDRAAVHKWQTIPSICLSRWTGEKFFPISYSEASWTGLLNFRSCQYEPTVVNLLPETCRKALPNLMDFSDTTVLEVGIQKTRSHDGKHNPYWDRWPELRADGPLASSQGCRLFLGLGDGACANIGSKCSTASRIAVTIGTSAAARVCLPFPICYILKASNDNPRSMWVPKGLFCYRINRSHILVGGALTDGGSVVEWISDLLNLNSSPEAFNECMVKVQTLVEKDYQQSQASEAAASQQSPKQSLTVVPFLSGERSTGYRDGATGAILGLTRETTSAHLLKSSLEGVTLRLNAILTLIRNAIVDDTVGREDKDQPCIIASGKALEVNSLWRELIADCSGMEVIMDGDTEAGTSRGAALAVAVAMGAPSEANTPQRFADEPLRPLHQSIPSPSARAYWAKATESQDKFLEAISPLFEPR